MPHPQMRTIWQRLGTFLAVTPAGAIGTQCTETKDAVIDLAMTGSAPTVKNYPPNANSGLPRWYSG